MSKFKIILLTKRDDKFFGSRSNAKKSALTWEEVNALSKVPIAPVKDKSWGRFFSSVSQADKF